MSYFFNKEYVRKEQDDTDRELDELDLDESQETNDFDNENES